MAAKIRPAVVVSIPRADSRRNMSVVVPLTTEMRGGETEIAFPKPRWLLDPCAMNLIGIGGVDNAKIVRLLGRMPAATMDAVSEGLVRMLGL